jgi:arginyl-tRNA synthetase
LRFIQPGDIGLTGARLALIAATKQVIFSGLALLGVHAPEEMR